MTRIKRTILIAQSVVLLLLTAVVLTVASFAWFVSGDPSAGSFDMQVAGSKDISVKFYEGTVTDAAAIAYTEIPAEGFPAVDKYYAGLTTYRKIEIYNNGDAASVSIYFTGVTAFGFEGTTEEVTAAVTHLDEMFVIQTADGPGADAVVKEDIRFVSAAVNATTVTGTGADMTGTGGADIMIASGLDVPAKATPAGPTAQPAPSYTFYYRFHMKPEAVTVGGVVRIQAGGIRFIAA